MYQCVLVLHLLAFLRHPWVFSRALGCGARRGAAWYTTAQVWVPGGLRGACSGRSKSRNLASSRGVALRGARAEQDNGKPIYIAVLLHCCKALYFAATVQQQSHIKFVWTTTMRVWTLHMRVCSVCAMIRACVQVRAGLCIGVLEAHTSPFCFFALLCCCCCCRIMSSSHHPSGSHALYFVAATVRQQSHSKFVWTTT